MSRKKVILVGPPFRGHLHPLLGIEKGLVDVADPLMVSTPGAVQLAESDGIPGRPVLVNEEQAVWEVAEPGVEVKGNPLRLYRQLRGNVSLMAAMKHELDTVFREEKPDLVIADFTVPVAGAAAQQQGIPWWTSVPSPCVIETPDGPPAYFGGQTPATTVTGRFRHAAMRRSTKLFKRLMWFWFRREFRELGFPGVYREDGSEAAYSPDRILALGYPEIEFPRSYPEHVVFTGPILYTPPCDSFSAHTSLDRPQVLITIGTHLWQAKKSLSDIIRRIANRHPEIEFHFSFGRESNDPPRILGNFHEYPYIAYDRVLPEYDLVVHHAGAGIMNHCLYHGVPSVVLPYDFDQFDNAARLVTAGLAIRAKRPEDLEQTLLTAMHDGELKRRCAEMADTAKSYEPGKTIADMIAKVGATGHSP